MRFIDCFPPCRRFRNAAALFLLAAGLGADPAPKDRHPEDWGVDPQAPPGVQSGLSRSEGPAKVQPLKDRAHAMYRAGRYREAVALYREVTALDTADAGVRNDLGLAFLKLGRKDSALAAGRECLRLAGRGLAGGDTLAWSFRDLRARKSAYFTLDRSGPPMPQPEPGHCEIWVAAPACRARLHACAETGRRSVPGGTLHWDILRIGLTRARALFGYDEVESPSLVLRPEVRDMEEVSIEGVPESKPRWLNRDSSATVLLEERLETGDPECPGAGNCGRLEKVLTGCRIVHFDPCAGVVGLACTLAGEDGRDRILVEEAYLIPAK